MSEAEWRLSVAPSLTEVDAAAWDACANPEKPNHFKETAMGAESDSQAPTGSPSTQDAAESAPEDAESLYQEETHNPFISHAFLLALEQSGSAVPQTGWAGAHLLLQDEQGRLAACAPAYLKSHSYGEYVFDHAWADAYERAGGRYYPKLQLATPFTPVRGRRLLTGTAAPDGPEGQALLRGLAALRRQAGASSIHATFTTPADQNMFEAAGFLRRTDLQYHWPNRGYRDYADFLDALSARKRKALKRERRDALAAGLAIRHRTGRDITEADWDTFFAFYMDTGARKWGQPYLTRDFFSRLGDSLADRVLLILALRDGRPIAGALNLIGDVALYGRHWGCVEDHPFLHFELCYHQAIEWAIAHRLARVEAGAQGEHKLARGYVPVVTHSAHFLADPGLMRPVAAYLSQERNAIDAARAEIAATSPYRRGT